jgi:hypothetical protein
VDGGELAAGRGRHDHSGAAMAVEHSRGRCSRRPAEGGVAGVACGKQRAAAKGRRRTGSRGFASIPVRGLTGVRPTRPRSDGSRR